MTKEELFEKLAEIEERLKRQYARKSGIGRITGREWSFTHLREDLWKNIESGDSTIEQSLDFAEKMGTLTSGESVTVGVIDDDDEDGDAGVRH